MKAVARKPEFTEQTEPQPKCQMLKIYTDGGARGNPGPAAFCVMLQDEHGDVVYKHSEYLGTKTNNQAEMLGIKHALERASFYAHGRIELYSDSQLAVRWLTGEYRVKSPNIIPLFEAIKECIRFAKFRKVEFIHVRRNHPDIETCDSELNCCLDINA